MTAEDCPRVPKWIILQWLNPVFLKQFFLPLANSAKI
uniref:Uncharacterized protein n=1 Tax=Anguilla anguilla TaxID=7936 RepID=A0A0E9Q726_ANGAN